jgi:lambda family phage tail tape measure protein
MATPTQVRRIVVKVSEEGSALKKIASGFAQLNKNVNQTTVSINKFRNIFAAIQGFQIAGFGLGNLVESLDTVQKFQTRLEALSGSAAAAQTAFSGLVQVANQNFTSISDLGVVYNRLALSLKESGISSEGLLAITDTLQKSFRLSGATASEATAAVIQLSQGLASGQLRGQELRSVLEQNSVVGGLLAKQLGTTRGELLKFAEKSGGISAVEFLKSLANGARDLDDAASKLRPTIREALTKNFNILQERLAKLNTELGLTEKAVSLIDAAFRNLDSFLKAGAIVLSLVAINKALGFLINAPTLLIANWSKFLSLPIVSTLTGIAAAFAGLIGWPAVLAGIGIFAVTAALAISDLGEESKIADKKLVDTRESIERIKLGLGPVASATSDAAKAQEEYNKAISGSFTDSRNYVVALDDVTKGFQATIEQFKLGEKQLGPLERAINVFQNALAGKNIFNFQASLKALNNEYSNTKDIKKYSDELKKLQIEKLTRDFDAGLITKIQYDQQLRDINLGKLVNNAREASFEIRKLNEEFAKDRDIIKFSTGLREINAARIEADTKQGRIDALTAEIEKNKIAVEVLNSTYANAGITLEKYNQTVNGIKINELNRQFAAGKLTLDQYYSSLVKLQGVGIGDSFNAGLSQYLSSAGTLASNFANVVDSTFQRLETSIFEFVKTGKFNFNQFTQAVLDDLLKIIIRAQIIAPLAQGLLGTTAPTASSGVALNYGGSGTAGRTAANGMAFNGPANYFANGGIVSGRSSFLYGSGMRGIMGEAGPEAIIPLKRDASGELGISGGGSNVTVNVINQANNTEVQQSERTDETGARILDVIIVSKVKEGMSKGLFDKQFETQFGLRRRGV